VQNPDSPRAARGHPLKIVPVDCETNVSPSRFPSDPFTCVYRKPQLVTISILLGEISCSLPKFLFRENNSLFR
jgi:hypothetical protein